MPQMAPLSWLTLMITFITVFIMFNIINYYSFMYKKSNINYKEFKITKTNWKW